MAFAAETAFLRNFILLHESIKTPVKKAKPGIFISRVSEETKVPRESQISA